MPEAAWTDQTVMPWGKHKGTKLGELEAGYLLWLYEQPWIKSWPGLHAYLKKHEDQLMQEKRNDDDDRDDELRTFDDYRNYR